MNDDKLQGILFSKTDMLDLRNVPSRAQKMRAETARPSTVFHAVVDGVVKQRGRITRRRALFS